MKQRWYVDNKLTVLFLWVNTKNYVLEYVECLIILAKLLLAVVIMAATAKSPKSLPNYCHGTALLSNIDQFLGVATVGVCVEALPSNNWC